MKKFLNCVLMAGMVLSLFGCAYGGVTAINKGKSVVITRNDGFLFGALRKVYVCKAGKSGLSDCKETEAP